MLGGRFNKPGALIQKFSSNHPNANQASALVATSICVPALIPASACGFFRFFQVVAAWGMKSVTEMVAAMAPMMFSGVVVVFIVSWSVV